MSKDKDKSLARQLAMEMFKPTIVDAIDDMHVDALRSIDEIENKVLVAFREAVTSRNLADVVHQARVLEAGAVAMGMYAAAYIAADGYRAQEQDLSEEAENFLKDS